MLTEKEVAELKTEIRHEPSYLWVADTIKELAKRALDTPSVEFANQLDMFAQELRVEASRTEDRRLSRNQSYYAGQLIGLALVIREIHTLKVGIW